MFRSKFLKLIVLFIGIGILIPTLSLTPVKAAGGEWVDRHAILRDSGGLFKDLFPELDNFHSYTLEEGDGCLSVIFFLSDTLDGSKRDNGFYIHNQRRGGQDQRCKFEIDDSIIDPDGDLGIALWRVIHNQGGNKSELRTEFLPAINASFNDIQDIHLNRPGRANVWFYEKDDQTLISANGAFFYGLNSGVYERKDEVQCIDKVKITGDTGHANDNAKTADYSPLDADCHGDPIHVWVGTDIAIRQDLKDKQFVPGGGGDEGTVCEGGAIGWIICPIIEVVRDVVKYVKENVIIPFLQTSPLQTHGSIYESWKNIRNVANVLLVIAFFVIIFAQALSLNIDAYTIKKMLPKLVAATILIQFSYYIAAFAVDVTNIIGNGVGGLLTSTIGSTGGDAAQFLGGVLDGPIKALTVISLALVAFFLAIPLLLSALLVLFTLIFRQLIIIMLVILAPVAFVAWILPNTQGVFKRWADFFVKALLMYPLVVLLFAAGSIFSNMLLSSDINLTDGSPTGLNELRKIAALATAIIPLFLVPFTFKFAGAGLAAIASGAQKGRGWLMGGPQGDRRLGKSQRKWQGGFKQGYQNVKAGRPGLKIPFGGGKELRAGPDSLAGRAASRLTRPFSRRSAIDASVLKGLGVQTEEAGKELKSNFADTLPVAQMILGGKQAYKRMTTNDDGTEKTGQERRNLDAIWATAKKVTSSMPHLMAASDIIAQAKQVDPDTREDLHRQFGGLPVGEKVWKNMQLGSIDKHPHLFSVDLATGRIKEGAAAQALAGRGIYTDKDGQASLESVAHAMVDKYDRDGGGDTWLTNDTITGWSNDARVSQTAKKLMQDAKAWHEGGGDVRELLANKAYRDSMGIKSELFKGVGEP